MAKYDVLKESLSDYTETEFVQLLEDLFKADASESDELADVLLLHFRKVSQHPAGSDLIYYPEEGADNSAEGITRTVKEWRAANGLPGFRQD
ncbi:bacteriocin immunity protein [Metapseudomonas lalkuanensis]|uniref:bacteriocin immunity protein n=1 Tax=Metapseudomonas lalkuanensis TaxID=2604832 RepID=UPI001CF4B839|nr:bacteriocin immunity protein [Pseudomonas lalkuanensis]UCO97340.1 bacteriocin immunity protein [Pseudomonas lalkuanensis]